MDGAASASSSLAPTRVTGATTLLAKGRNAAPDRASWCAPTSVMVADAEAQEIYKKRLGALLRQRQEETRHKLEELARKQKASDLNYHKEAARRVEAARDRAAAAKKATARERHAAQRRRQKAADDERKANEEAEKARRDAARKEFRVAQRKKAIEVKPLLPFAPTSAASSSAAPLSSRPRSARFAHCDNGSGWLYGTVSSSASLFWGQSLGVDPRAERAAAAAAAESQREPQRAIRDERRPSEAPAPAHRGLRTHRNRRELEERARSSEADQLW